MHVPMRLGFRTLADHLGANHYDEKHCQRCAGAQPNSER